MAHASALTCQVGTANMRMAHAASHSADLPNGMGMQVSALQSPGQQCLRQACGAVFSAWSQVWNRAMSARDVQGL